MVVGCLSRFGSFAFRVVCLQRPCRPVGTGVRMESCCVPTEKGAIYVPSGFKDLVDAETAYILTNVGASNGNRPLARFDIPGA